ncbi:anion permease [Salmonella enterica]|nr:anion permease [Salmonella enterica]EJA7806195.1 anion permease [Salmonella enterica]EJA7823214.1 anion permease [Salmonella enterica]EJB6380763.1 anion permease [Salmonella enterica]
MAEKKSQGVKWLPFILILVIAAGLWQLTPPSGLSAPAWHSAIIFVATIASIVAKVLPIGAVGIIGITVFALAYAAGDKTASGAITTALSELNSSLIWLIVVAFMIARGFIKTGLGRRIALQMIRLLGKRTLGLAYGLAFADLILSPAMPSNTARCGGVIYPIADSLARSFDSHPEDESRSKIGTFLITCIGNVNDVTAALFMTGYTGNLLAVKLAANAGVTLSWGSWFIAALYAVFLGVGLHLNIPAAPMALMLAFTSSLYCSLTQYTHARGPILFGAGYVPTGVWWRTGFIISLFNQAVFLTVGLAWWKVLGLY